MPTPAFNWIDPDRGEDIERFIRELAVANPTLLHEVLNIGFGDLRTWTETSWGGGSIAFNAKCGCLIGSCAIGAVKLGLASPQDSKMDFDNGTTLDTIPLTLAAAINIDAQRLQQIGYMVADEVDEIRRIDENMDTDTRNLALAEHLTNYIKSVLAVA